MNLNFRYDAGIFGRLDGDTSPLQLRIPPEDAIDKEFTDPDRYRKWNEYIQKNPLPPPTETLYHCGAGIQSFHVTADGFLTPCIMVTEPSYDLKTGSFSDGWHHEMLKVRDKLAAPHYPCNHCDIRQYCNYCPAIFKLDTGREDHYSEFICRSGKLRHEQLAQYCESRSLE
jgi:radical SAM protein with 4Fe4S-binding SPASM domain